MYNTPSTMQRARKPHRCTYCAQTIQPGERYERWATYSEGSCLTNKMHQECALATEAGGEYVMFENDRPVKVEVVHA